MTLRALISTFLITACCLAAGCSKLAYHPTIQQGNIISSNSLKSIQPGMSKQQVVAALGTPLLQNTFSPSHVTYIYTIEPNRQSMQTKKIILTFQNNQLKKIDSNLQ